MNKNIYDDETFFKAYGEMPRSIGGLQAAGEWYVLKQLLPDFQNSSVLDLGCGYGWHCKYAVEHGASKVVGIDASKKMLEEAINRNNAEKIEYRNCGILDYEYPSDAFDVVVSNLALHYIEDLNTVYQNVYKTLKKDGTFIFNIEHPVFTAGVNKEWINENNKNLYWPVDNYYYPGERTTVFLNQKVKKYHHTFTQIVNGLIENGFMIETLKEVEPSEEFLKYPGMLDEMRRPMMLIVKAKKKGE